MRQRCQVYTLADPKEKRGGLMYTVIRTYSGPGAKELCDVMAERQAEIETLIRGVKGNIGYSMTRTADGAVSVTICEDKAGTDESVKVAAEWVKSNMATGPKAPEVTEGSTIIHW
jgi:hypothetical protein